MKKNSLLTLWVLICLFSFLRCGPDSSTNLGSVESSAVGLSTVFSSFGSSQSISSSNLIRHLDSSVEICSRLEHGPSKVILMENGAGAGSFGSFTDSFAAEESDLCATTAGMTNSGTASDGRPLFASFFFIDEIEGTCTEDGVGTSVIMTKGSGIVRYTDEYMPEIYGQFEVNGAVIDCTLRLLTDGSLDSARSSCTDVNHEPVAISSTTTCTESDAHVPRIELPTRNEGLYSSQNAARDCWEFNPFTLGSDDFIGFSSSCTEIINYGFNIESFNIGVVVGGDSSNWGIYRTTDFTDIAHRIKLMHTLGNPILVTMDIHYVAAYDGTNDEVLDGASDFPQDLVDNAIFQEELLTEMIDVASLAEALNIELFAPLSEGDRIFTLSNATNPASTFLQNSLGSIKSQFTGKLVWIAADYDSTDSAAFNMSGFDYAGINVSPSSDQKSIDDFITHVRTQLDNMKTIADSFDIPYLITNAGIWAGVLTNPADDWGRNSSVLLGAFTTMDDESETYGTPGIIFWEGANDDAQLDDNVTHGTFTSTDFGDSVSAF